jgi:hypothetical protein
MTRMHIAHRLARIEQVVATMHAPTLDLGERLRAARARGPAPAQPLLAQESHSWAERELVRQLNAAGRRMYLAGDDHYAAFAPAGDAA